MIYLITNPCLYPRQVVALTPKLVSLIVFIPNYNFYPLILVLPGFGCREGIQPGLV